MIRPRLRPTVSRRIKYLGIAPAAQKKLGKEARRGSHDLRRLVGHAQFLDTLVDNLADDDEDEKDEVRTEDVISPGPEDAIATPSPPEAEDFNELDDESGSDAETESDSEAWSDSSDDDDHMLSRTVSGRPVIKAGSREASPDYFSRPVQKDTEIARKAEALRLRAEASIRGGGNMNEDSLVETLDATAASSKPEGN